MSQQMKKLLRWDQFQRDLDYKFDAPEYFDLSKEEPVLETTKIFEFDTAKHIDPNKEEPVLETRKELEGNHLGEFQNGLGFEFDTMEFCNLSIKELKGNHDQDEFQTDSDFEFDAPKYVDLSREETVSDTGLVEKWFDTAKSDPPSKRMIKIMHELGILSEDNGDNIPDTDAERNL